MTSEDPMTSSPQRRSSAQTIANPHSGYNPPMPFPSRLVPCPSCDCFMRPTERRCPHCGEIVTIPCQRLPDADDNVSVLAAAPTGEEVEDDSLAVPPPPTTATSAS